jgi:ADP-heptose:LPS heptosyltransferase
VPVTWYVLQGYPGLHERPSDFGTVVGATDILELARAIRSLDLVITIDSLAAHLAGALAASVWTVLATDADWRWMIDRDDSPWYPTMRLFRQERPGEWAPVVQRVARELERLAAARARHG